MEEKKDEVQDSSPEGEIEDEESKADSSVVSEDGKTPIDSELEETQKTEEKTVPYARFKEINKRLIDAEKQIKRQPIRTVNTALDVDDYIDISASLEGLDQREKEYIAEQHKYSGKSLSEIRKDENFLLWQEAYRQKVEKEKSSLEPSSTQTESDMPMSLDVKLKNAKTLGEKEKILIELGLYKQVRPRADKIVIEGKS